MRDPSERDAHAAHGRSPVPHAQLLCPPTPCHEKDAALRCACFVFLCVFCVRPASRVFPPAKDLLLALSGSDVRGPRPVEGPSHPQLDRRWSLHLRRSPNRGRRQQPVIWVNQVVGTTHVVNNETGDHIACNAFGKPIPPFHPGVSGVANTKERLELELKVRPARARRPVQGRKPASLVFVAWPADVPCVCGMVAGREMGEVAAEEGAAEATAAGAGAAAGARVNHRPIRWEDAGRDRPAPEQGIYTGPGSQQPMRHPPEASPAIGHSHWAALRLGGACLSLGRRSGLRRPGALTPAHRRRPRSLRTA